MTLQQPVFKAPPPPDAGSLGDWLKALGILAAIAALVVWIGSQPPQAPAPAAPPAATATESTGLGAATASAAPAAPVAAAAPAAAPAPVAAAAPATTGVRYYSLTRADRRGPFAAIVDPIHSRSQRNACRSALAGIEQNRSLLRPGRVRSLRVGTCFALPDACAPSPAWNAAKATCP